MSSLPPKEIRAFIARHHVLTLATTEDGQPHCSNMFYAYIPERNVFVFTSERHTLHASQALKNPQASASIVLETRVVGKVRGLQLRGEVRPVNESDEKHTKAAFLHRFPYTVVTELYLWVFTPGWMKLTDNTLGFGKKIIWQKNE